MKFTHMAIFMTILGVKAFGECELKEPNQVLNLIKLNHPSIMLNKAKVDTSKESITMASESPNPELDLSTVAGKSEGVHTAEHTLEIKHRFELGGKRDSRIQVATNSFKTAKAFSRYQNESTIIDVVIKLHRLRQVHELIPLYEESLQAFSKILVALKKRKSLSPEQQVERGTLELATNDYKLKISQLDSEKINLNKHLSFFMGSTCLIPKLALPPSPNLDETFAPKSSLSSYSKLEAARLFVETAKSSLELQKSNATPDLRIGPTYKMDKEGANEVNSLGLALSIDLPVFNTNSAGKAKAAKELIAAKLSLKYIQDESLLDLEAWIAKYKRFSHSLKTIANKEDLERKHQKIERLFKRGIISTSLVIESHRQLIEFSNTRFDFEQGAVEALWEIYKINGEIQTKKI